MFLEENNTFSQGTMLEMKKAVTAIIVLGVLGKTILHRFPWKI